MSLPLLASIIYETSPSMSIPRKAICFSIVCVFFPVFLVYLSYYKGWDERRWYDMLKKRERDALERAPTVQSMAIQQQPTVLAASVHLPFFCHKWPQQVATDPLLNNSATVEKPDGYTGFTGR